MPTKHDFAQQLLSGRLTLEQALFSDILEARALHTFACDCAERALLCETMQYRDVPEKLQRAIAIKRDWIDGQCQRETLEKARERALKELKESKRWRPNPRYAWLQSSYHLGIEGQSAAHAIQAGVWAISPEGEDAAENAAREACEAIVFARGTTRDQERAWQRRRLAFVHELSTLTTRMWLAFDDQCPLPIERPKDAALDAFDA